MRALAIVLLLCACAAPAVEPPRALDIPTSVACPLGAVQPVAPPAPRTVDAVVAYANALRRALSVTEDARAECARRLNRMVALVRKGDGSE